MYVRSPRGRFKNLVTAPVSPGSRIGQEPISAKPGRIIALAVKQALR